MENIKIWHIGNGRYYCKVPVEKRKIMGNKYICFTYMKDGRFKYLQYEITKEEAETILTYGALIPRKSKNKNRYQEAI
jgi:hypothetical protein